MTPAFSSDRSQIHPGHQSPSEHFPVTLSSKKPPEEIHRVDKVGADDEPAFLTEVGSRLHDLAEVARHCTEMLWEHHCAYLDADAARHLRMLLRACDQLDRLAYMAEDFARASRLEQVVPNIDLRDLIEEHCRRHLSPDMLTELNLPADLPKIISDPELLHILLRLLLEDVPTTLGNRPRHVEIGIADGSRTTLYVRHKPTDALPELGSEQAKQIPMGAIRNCAERELKIKLARRIAQTLGGRLWGEVQPDRQITTFYFEFPEQPPEPTYSVRPHRPHLGAEAKSPKPAGRQ
jgi:light-regulated signal transduction histidine kinase (bacteriophytochrome)